MIKEYVRKILNNIVEDVRTAENILKDRNIPLNDERYLRAKKLLLNNNMIGYLGFIVKLLNKTSEILRASEFFVNNKEIIKSLPKQMGDYSSYHEIVMDINNIIDNRTIKKFVNKLSNKILKKLVLSEKPDKDTIKDMADFLSINKQDQKEFLIKSNRYNDTDTFFNDLHYFIDDIKKGFNKENLINLISSMDKNDIELLYNKNNFILVRVHTYYAASQIGSTAWCIVTDEQSFNNYTQDGYQYFLFDFNDPEPNKKMLAFTLSSNNNVVASHDRYDKPFNDIIKYLRGKGIIDKIYFINKREIFKSLLKEPFVGDYGDPIMLLYDKNGNKEVSFKRDVESLAKIFVDILTNNVKNDIRFNNFYLVKYKNNEHLDLIMDKFQNYPVYSLTGYYNEKYKKIGFYNIVPYALTEENKSEKFINVLKKIINSNIRLKKETIFDITRYLKDHDEDVLDLVTQRRNKTKDDITDTEFNLKQRRGDNMRPLIQNKLGALRRGEDVNLTVSEIRWAINNGFKEQIKKYYSDMLDHFEYNQLSFGDLDIYKDLGMLSDISSVIKNKANNFGIDTLNSIEKSVYDYV